MQSEWEKDKTMRGFVSLVLVMELLTLVRGQFQEATTALISGSNVSALFVLGDSTVDCGDNTLFYPLLHARLSLYSCEGSDASLLPQILGNFLFLSLLHFLFLFLTSYTLHLDFLEILEHAYYCIHIT